MPEITRTFDPVWENGIYGSGRHVNRWPFDMVVSFVFRNAPRNRNRSSVQVLEVGCGVGNNLWFAAREGFQVAGIDGSAHAIEFARKRFAEEGLEADLRVGDFTQLPFDDASFDLVIDRGAVTCSGRTAARMVVAEVWRVLRAGGKFLFNPYCDCHRSCASGVSGPDGVTRDISSGTLTGVGQICFYSRAQLESLFPVGWQLQSVEHLEIRSDVPPDIGTHAEWRVIVMKN